MQKVYRCFTGIAILTMIAAAVPNTGLTAGLPHGENPKICIDVVDGDTIAVADSTGSKPAEYKLVRLIGIDAPEKDGPYTKKEPFAEESTRHLSALVAGKRVHLEFDREKKDKFGRLLAYVFLDDGTFVNWNMIRSGWAEVFRNYEYWYRERFFELEAEARAECLGIWKTKCETDKLREDK